MSLKDTIQTAFLIVGFFTLLVFGASYYFMFLDTTPTRQPLKDSLSITASFFGGFATLTAAFIASRLFNDWRDIHAANYLTSTCKSLAETTGEIYSLLLKLDVPISKSEEIKGGFQVSLLSSSELKDIFDNIPIILELIDSISIEIKNLDFHLINFNVATQNKYPAITAQYKQIVALFEVEAKKIRKKQPSRMRYQTISQSRKSFEILLIKIKDFHEKSTLEIARLNGCINIKDDYKI